MNKIASFALVFALFAPAAIHAAGPPPVIAVQPLGVSVLPLGTATFTVVAVSGTTLSYKWYHKGVRISGNNATASTSILVLTSVNNGDAGDYTVEVSNSGGTVTSTAATLTVAASQGLSITSQPQSQSLAAGQSASLSVTASSVGTLSYQWKLNGAALTGATNQTLNLSSVRTNNAGDYTVDVFVPGLTVSSGIATLVVTNPLINLAASGGGSLGLTPSGFSFQMAVPVGCTYVVEATSDAVNWSPIATNYASVASVVFTDAAAVNHGSRFYRVRVQ